MNKTKLAELGTGCVQHKTPKQMNYWNPTVINSKEKKNSNVNQLHILHKNIPLATIVKSH